MKQFFCSVSMGSLRRLLTVSGVLLVSGALAMAQMQQQQQQPMGSQPNPANNPNSQINPMGQMQAQQNAAAGTMQDKAFLRKALEGGMFEVQAGQLAGQKSQSQDVQQFGQKMMQDHAQLGDELKPIATQMGVKPPDKLSKKDGELLTKLQGMSGAQFDQAYIKAMVKDHKDDMSQFKQEAENTQNPQLKQAAQQGMQAIDQHLHLAEQMAKGHSVKS